MSVCELCDTQHISQEAAYEIVGKEQIPQMSKEAVKSRFKRYNKELPEEQKWKKHGHFKLSNFQILVMFSVMGGASLNNAGLSIASVQEYIHTGFGMFKNPQCRANLHNKNSIIYCNKIGPENSPLK